MAPLGVIMLAGGSLFLLDGVLRSYQEFVQANRWSASEARVVHCTIAGSYHYSGRLGRRVWGKASYVLCTFDFPLNGVEHQSTAQIGNSIFTSKEEHTLFRTSDVTVDKMQDWIRRHPSGSVVTIHYDPSNADRVSVAGEDHELLLSSPHDRLWSGVSICAIGLLIIVITRSMRNRQAKPAHSVSMLTKG